MVLMRRRTFSKLRGVTSPLFLQNTLSRAREELVPRQPGTVSLYVCGVTPYDALHIGHARAFMAYDVLRRVLESRGLSVQHIQNVTDVEDKIINRAKESGEEPLVLAKRFSDEALEDTCALNILPAHQYPRVSDNIIPILDLIRGLEDKGFAYAKGGDVYFDVSKDLDYGKLSGQKPEELESGARIEVDELKDDPLDFALWKGAKPNEPSWSSPYGNGRPGWHIECSAMALNILGPGFDIHGGARELVFPHHENEVAQSESYLGKGETFAKVWWHCGELRVEGRKMSKSLGNFLTVRDALKLADANVWRLLFLMTHPRSPLDYSPKKLQEAQSAWARLENALLEHDSTSIEYSNGAGSDAARAFQTQFDAALSDDLNTPEAIAAVFDAVGEWNRTQNVEVAQAARRAMEVLGFTFQAKEIGDALTPKLLDVLIKVRNDARERRDWKTGDNVRDELKTLGVVLEDTPDGTKWKIERGATV
jgi:cysteinyl-tRNA synthetase